MKKLTVEIETKQESGAKVSWTGEVEVPESTSEAVAAYGEEVVADIIASQIKTNRMNIARAALRGGASSADVAAAAASYVPGQKRERAPQDPTQAILSNFGKMDAEAKKALIAQLRQQLAGG